MERRKFWVLYTLVLVLPFFWQLPILLGLSVAFPMQMVFRPFLLCAGSVAVTGLWLTSRKQLFRLTLDARILLLAFGWMVLVFLLHRHVLEEAGVVLQRAAVAWLIFYPFGFLLDGKEARRSLAAVSACWTAVMTLLAGIGLACAVSRTALENLSGNLAFGMLENRLHLGIWTTSTSENLLTGWMMAAVGVVLTKKRWARWLYGAAMALLLAAMALTDGRNGMLSMGIFVGSIAFVLLWNRKKRTFFGAAAAAALCILVVYFGCIRIQQAFPKEYTQVKSLRDMMLSPFLPEQPKAVETAVSGDTHRKIDATLNGRSQIWQGALRGLRTNADNVLLAGRPGTTWRETLQKLQPDFPEVEHLHNIYLQGIMEYGIPGAVLMGAFLLFFAGSGWKQIASGEGVERFVPIPAGVLLVSELADAFTRFAQDNIALYVLFLFAGLSISCAQKRK